MTRSADVAYYVDTSAFLKLVVTETWTAELRAWLEETDADLVSSDLLRVEALRAARRRSAAAMAEVRARLGAVGLLSLTADLCERAAELDPSVLRSLDALHLAGALALGDELQGILTYDDRLAAAAAAHGVAVVTPR